MTGDYELSAENLEVIRRFGGEPDRYGIGVVVIDCSVENLGAMLDAVRDEAASRALAQKP